MSSHPTLDPERIERDAVRLRFANGLEETLCGAFVVAMPVLRSWGDRSVLSLASPMALIFIALAYPLAQIYLIEPRVGRIQPRREWKERYKRIIVPALTAELTVVLALIAAIMIASPGVELEILYPALAVPFAVLGVMANIQRYMVWAVLLTVAFLVPPVIRGQYVAAGLAAGLPMLVTGIVLFGRFLLTHPVVAAAPNGGEA